MKIDINKFNSDGYILIKSLISEKDKFEIESSVEGLINDVMKKHCPSVNLPDIDSKWTYLAKNFPELKSRIYDLTKYLFAIARFSTSAAIQDYISQLLGKNYLMDKAQIRFDDNQNARLLPLHQEGYGQFSFDSINIWTPLIPTGIGNGGLAVIPSSHLQGELPHKFYSDNGNAHGVQEEFIKASEVKVINTDFGDAIIFHSLLVHGSTENNSCQIRKTFVARFSSIKNLPYLSDLMHPLFIPQA